uniref:Uncharacterized protein n=1 Tax=Lepeophtheirus salmonis TaxID=72036 RepID=A0A0K2TIJ5_LEPSM
MEADIYSPIMFAILVMSVVFVSLLLLNAFLSCLASVFLLIFNGVVLSLFVGHVRDE